MAGAPGLAYPIPERVASVAAGRPGGTVAVTPDEPGPGRTPPDLGAGDPAHLVAALRDSERELRLITDAVPLLIAFVDRDLVYRFANRSYEDWLGIPVAQVVGRSVRAVFGEDGFQARLPPMRRALAGEASRLEIVALRRDGARRHCEIRYLPRRDEMGAVDGFHLVAVDVTERKDAEEALRAANNTLERRVEERTRALALVNDQLQAEMLHRERTQDQLRQAQKMEAVGQLTGGLAHDFNNLLAGIVGSLELLQMRAAQGRTDGMDRFLAAAKAAAGRAASLTHRLLAFARRQTLDSRPIDANELAGGMAELIRRTVGPAIAVEIAPDPALWTTLCDPNQLENALLNLCINARDAMPDGGVLRIATGNRPLGPDQAAAHDLLPGLYVALRVTDTGAGMRPEVIARAFDPFFTTKPLGQGTGLGLSMIYGFTRQSGGGAIIESEAGRGTSVTLLLPRHEGEPEATPAHSVLRAMPRARPGETVLVVDDEDTVRLLVGELLTELGYAVTEAADAASALGVLRSATGIDLLVTDIGLPGGLNGRQLADAARTHRQGLRILFITGYAEAALGNGPLGPGLQVMTKPFALDALAARIRAMLDDGATIP